MNRILIGAVAAAALCLNITEAVHAAPPDGPSACRTVSLDGYCGVEFGMSVDTARNAFPGGLPAFEPLDDEADCYYLGTAKDDYEVAFMVVYGVIERIDVSASWVSTAEGARIGMTLDEVEALYPGAARKPNFYTAPDEDLVVTLDANVFAVFQTSFEGPVDHFHVGRKPAVDYVEGCS